MSEMQTEGYLQRTPWLLFSFDDQSNFLSLNKAVSDLIGEPESALIGTSMASILTKAGQIFFQTHFFPIIKVEGRVDEVFLLLRKSGGEPLPVLAYGIRFEHNGSWVNECYCAPIPQRRKFEQELIQARKDAEDVLRQNKALNEAKQALEDNRAELDRRIQQLERANNELGQIAKVVLHDLREPIRKIAILTDFIRSNPEPFAEENRPMFDQINRICQSTSRLITGLRDFIALDTTAQAFAPVQLETLIRNAALEATETNLFATDTDWLLASHVPDVLGYAPQLHLLFYHLFDNAIRFRRTNVPLRVQLTAEVIKENKFVAVEETYQYTDHLRIRVRDNGKGFPSRYRSDVFLLLKRLDKTTPTLGLGLAICRKIMGNHYGTITADSQPGEGTTFTILLPLGT